ncbi:hypothetical protein [Psychromonas sp. GE-S-Ul-11]|uniref:hypothetical protein n=1 Tax=Psychromonas sp. GE-S-Ul-11 TaxID=3241170 RepID=UPI00390C4D24
MAKAKQLSNPFSTGNGGGRFESQVQANFVTLMLTGGYAPCLPCWPIVELKLQGMVDGYATDDLIVFIEEPVSKDRRKLLGQVKHSISITAGSETFAEVIKAAWDDFNNEDLFIKGKDVIALITGPISTTDYQGVCGLLEQARHTKNSDEFLTNVDRAKFSSNNARTKLAVIRTQLAKANNNVAVSNLQLHEFLKDFHLLGYDLAKPGSIISSLLQSHIGQYNKQIPNEILSQIITTVQSFNQNAGTITLENLPSELVKHFKLPELSQIPANLQNEQEEKNSNKELIDFNNTDYATYYSVAVMIGSWSEAEESDVDVLKVLTDSDYSVWKISLREALQSSHCPLDFSNGIWKVENRDILFKQLTPRIFDENLDRFQEISLTVLKDISTAFELKAEERYAANIYKKGFKYSLNLRAGIVEGLAMISNQSELLVNASSYKAESLGALVIRNVFENADWRLWAGLNGLLPDLSEIAPEAFLTALENTLISTPEIFKEIFHQEDTRVFGTNYLTGLLWALEALAWDENLLVRVSIVLAELASLDPGGRWSNRPINSLTEILLSWKPQTTANLKKRTVAIQTICNEQSLVGRRLLVSLLPNEHRTSTPNHKPKWRKVLPDDWENKGVTKQEYWEQSLFCANLLINLAGSDIESLADIVSHFSNLPKQSQENFLHKCLVSAVIEADETERLLLWNKLNALIARHRKFSNAKWSLSEEVLLPLQHLANKLAPQKIENLYLSLFSYRQSSQIERDEDVRSERRDIAIKELLEVGELELVLRFSNTVEDSEIVGQTLAKIGDSEIDSNLLPDNLLSKDNKNWPFIKAYIWARQALCGWEWVDKLDRSTWHRSQNVTFLLCLPFKTETWKRVESWLGDKQESYWKNSEARAFRGDDDENFELAISKLIEVGRFSAAINCYQALIYGNEHLINVEQASKALLGALTVKSEQNRVEQNTAIKMIEYLQQTSATDINDLFHIEWAYLPLLEDNDINPLTLENKLATEPAFFCELIQLMYRSTNDERQPEATEAQRKLASNAYNLLGQWKQVPGTSSDIFDSSLFNSWLDEVIEITQKSGHLDIALLVVGEQLIYSPSDSNGLWINLDIAKVLNDKKYPTMRDGFRTAKYNARGVYTRDSTGNSEMKIASSYREQAEQVEEYGFNRIAIALRELADSYDRDVKQTRLKS